ncbi:DUF6506 family protein [Cuneatibacter caecimuris]|uniref:Uncharacterized protein n=1 Tax=Cuneatibacter caecimuris TaxID=1796618 RepID=A0A4Q7PLB2_9FIRM|nr:DUF6506 family protein [Cuneatibacter caecimuris]RZT00661.1 hypothetical protein EV209_1985 [Cuneatibacter caecimuris]
MRKFAFLLMGPQFDPEKHRAEFQVPGMVSYIRTVRDFTEAKAAVQQLAEDGVKAMEVCGAFGPERTRELIEITGGKVAVGYVTHFPEQDELFDTFFKKS